MTKKKIFEEPQEDIKPELVITEDDLIENLDNDIKEAEEKQKVKEESKPEPKEEVVDEVEEVEEEKPKKKRAKRPMTEERRQMLIQNLAKGRATSLERRKKAAEAKKITKKNKEDAINKIIEDDKKLKETKLMKQDTQLLTEFNEMKSMMKTLMEENKKLKTKKEEPKLETVKEVVNQPKMEPPKPQVVPMRIARSRGIGSRWNKYKR